MSQFLPDIRQGDRYEISIRYPAGTDLTGYRFWFTLKRQLEDADSVAVLQVVSDAGSDIHDEPTNGLVFLSALEYLTGSAPKGSYYWDIQSRGPSGQVKTIAPPAEFYDDKIRIVPQVTRAQS